MSEDTGVLKNKAKTFNEWAEKRSKLYDGTDGCLNRVIAFEKTKLVLLSEAKAEIEKYETKLDKICKQSLDTLNQKADETEKKLEAIQKQLRHRAIRLLRCRAGGRYDMFEAGMLYQTCLTLGMKESRKGKIGEQEFFWQKMVLSCFSESEAKEKLEKILSEK